jgi:hypothetical protein
LSEAGNVREVYTREKASFKESRKLNIAVRVVLP